MPEYNLEYLNQLILNKVEENLNLDYKAAGALNKQNNKTTEISKDVSALANSDGGIIIYGIKEGEVNKHLPEKIDPINRKQFSKEWLEQIIQDKIRPRMSDFIIHPIDIDEENVVYVVEVQQSNTAHQAFDKRYYKRFNFQSTAMYDYEIRDILNRSKSPKISLEFKLTDSNSKLVVFARNTGAAYAKYVNVWLRLPKKIVLEDYYSSHDINTYEIGADNTVRDIVDIKNMGMAGVVEKYGPSRHEPILPTLRFKLTEIELHNFPFDYENEMEWEVFCDNTQPQRNKIRLTELLNK